MVDKRVEHDFMLMSVVAVIGILAMFLFINSESLGSASLTGYAVSEVTGVNPSCSDSDGGLDYSTKGYLSGNLPQGFKAEDSCVWGVLLREVYCKDNQAASRTTYCSHGCSNGFCKGVTLPPVCGDGKVEGRESCDGTNFNGKSCQSLGFRGGELGCNKYCGFVLVNCTKPVCGNGVKEIAEVCDGADLGGRTCRSFGFASGTLKCNQNCKLNASDCIKICSSSLECGERICNGMNVRETCENGRCVFKMNCTETKCAKEGEYTSGTVAPEYQYGCCAGLKGFDPYSGLDPYYRPIGGGNLCYNPEKGTPVCRKQGNVEGWYYPKTGQLLRADTCMKNASIQTRCTDSDGGKDYYVKGTVTASNFGTSFDSCFGVDSMSVNELYCENGVAKETQYKCPNGCQNGACVKQLIDINFCGDGMISPGEECDGAWLNGLTCASFGFDSGILGCTASCKLDTTRCTRGMRCSISSDCPQPATIPGYKECNGNSLCSVTGGYDCMDSVCVLSKKYFDCLNCPGGCVNGACIPAPVYCGNRLVDVGEQCDGSIGSVNCAAFGFTGGSVSCSANCTYNTARCIGVTGGACGDGVVEVGEQCEGTNSNGKTCATFGFVSGTLRCNNCQFDTSGCIPAPLKICGDGVKNQLIEDCDGRDFGGQTCQSLGYAGGTLGCKPDCKFNTSNCVNIQTYCGDGIVQKPNSAGLSESCDSPDFGGRTCLDFGYNGGTLRCSGDCTFDFSSCGGNTTPRCGDGIVNQNAEECDGTDLSGETCVALGYDSGTLKCTTGCKFDKSSCALISIGKFCGDGVISSPNDVGFNEQCDGSNLGDFGICPPGSAGGATSISNPVRCRSDCTLDYSGCNVISCGDGAVNQVSEQCDGNNLNARTCVSLGFVGGVLRCTSGCLFDTTTCIEVPPLVCGDGIVSRPNAGGFNEECDGSDFRGMTCTNLGNFVGGSLTCTGECTFNLNDCLILNPVRCGDGVINQQSEECDGTDLKGLSCIALGFDSGTLACGNDCKYDNSGCRITIIDQPRCGDNVINQKTEVCDGADLGGKTCIDLGYVSSEGLECTGSCAFDPRGCSMCNNNGVCQPGMGETADNCAGDCIFSPVGVALYTNPGAIDVAVDNRVTFDIKVSSITDLYGYQFDIEYDPKILGFISLEDGAFLTDTSTQLFCMAPAAAPGVLDNIACTRTGAVGGVSGSGLLKRITFGTLASGTSSVTISNAKLVDSESGTITTQVLSGQISVS